MCRLSVPLISLAVLMLAGCATYTRLPLATHSNLATTAATLSVPVKAFDTPGVHVTRVDLTHPLNADDLAALAVLNNPSLAALRTQLGVATAQSYAAGLIPWPQIGLGRNFPDNQGPGLYTAWSVSVSEEFDALLQHADAEQAARAHESRVRLELVWNEWQVAQQARLLYAALEYDAAQLQALHPLLVLYAEQVRSGRAAWREGGISRATVTAANAMYAQLLSQLNLVALQRAKNRDALTALLGLAPHTPLKLALADHPTLLPDKLLPAALAALPHRRPDLMALAAAYRSADARLRQAVLAQFPLISVTLNRRRGTDGVISHGLSLNFNLPFLNGARGQVAVARATRRQLHAVYQARLDTAVSEAASLGDAENRLHKSFLHLQQLHRTRDQTNSHLPGPVPFNTLATDLSQRMQLDDALAELRYRLDRTTIALETVLGLPLKPATAAAPT